MRNTNPSGGRLVKVLLPAHLVVGMDEVITASGSYADRSQFIADAIDGHLAELRARAAPEKGLTNEPSGLAPTRTDTAEAQSRSRPVMATIPPVPSGTPTLKAAGATPAGPTWGMHNRDFPTLWALAYLVRATGLAGEPLTYSEWLPDVVSAAWDLGRRLPTDRFDVSGFPANQAKREASEGRFVKFFVGDEPGDGPMFDLGLAGSDSAGNVAATPAGLKLLTAIEGFSCERGRGIPREWTEVYLRHLGRFAPADLAFMAEVLGHIRSGHDDRTALVEAAASEHPDWSGSVVETNVAGFIARAREWGLLLPRQHKGKYVLEDEAMAVLEEATEA